MVGPGEVDEDLEPETAEECTKYGKVIKCVIFEVSLLCCNYYTPRNEVRGGILESPCPSVRLSVDARAVR